MQKWVGGGGCCQGGLLNNFMHKIAQIGLNFKGYKKTYGAVCIFR